MVSNYSMESKGEAPIQGQEENDVINLSDDYPNENEAKPEIASQDEDLNEDLLRGDAIGDTVYSGSFVLRTILKLANFEGALSDEPEFEQHLCQVWDMTTNSDVVSYLYDLEVIQILYEALVTSIDDRLSEILVGILGNLCVDEMVCKDILGEQIILDFLFNLSAIRDTETLIQLFRMFSCLSIKANDLNQAVKLHESISKTKFYGDLCEILLNSTSPQLINEALRFLNSLTKVFITHDQKTGAESTEPEESSQPQCFTKDLLDEPLLNATIEALKIILEKQDHLEESLIYFLNIHNNLILFCFGGSYKPLEELYKTINSIIRTTINEDILAIVDEILESKEISFWPEILMEYLETFYVFTTDSSSHDEFDSVDGNLNSETLSLIKKFIFKQLSISSEGELCDSLLKSKVRKQHAEYFCKIAKKDFQKSSEEGNLLENFQRLIQYLE